MCIYCFWLFVVILSSLNMKSPVVERLKIRFTFHQTLDMLRFTPVIIEAAILYCSSCAHHRDYCENSFWDLHTIVAIHNDTAVAFTDPPTTRSTRHIGFARALPGYGSFKRAEPSASPVLPDPRKTDFLVFLQTRSYQSQDGFRPVGDNPVRLSGGRRRVWRSGRGSARGGARSICRRDRES